MRRPPPRRVSRLAQWSRRAGILAVPLMLGAAIAHRAGLVDIQATLLLLAASFALAGCAIIGALGAFGGIWRDGRQGFGAAVLGLVLGAAVLIYPGVLAARVATLPALSDISTDLADPPPFTAAEAPRTPPERTDAARQAEAYPDVTSRIYGAGAAQVFVTVATLVEERRWTVLRSEPPVEPEPPPPPVPEPAAAAEDAPSLPVGTVPTAPPGETMPAPEALPAEPAPPLPEPEDGVVEAVARAGFIGFEEDVVIRVRPGPAGTVVDMRSASRLFSHDFGSNAERIEAFLDDLDARLSGG